MAVQVEVWGEYACFSRPELKVERVSYEVMTPSAARGLLEAIYWHPGLSWKIDRIHVLAPIRFTNVRRNEVKSTISARNAKSAMYGSNLPLYLCTSEEIQQRSALILRDVHYVIDAHFTMTERAAPGDTPGKFQDIMLRRLQKGQCYHQPYLGCREFPASFRRWTEGPIPTISDSRDLGLMLLDKDYRDGENICSEFFRGRLISGILEVAGCEVFR
jgi:CRISPR-associated protein Cas5d